MKKTVLIFAAIMFFTTTFAQRKEKIKGSKIITVEKKEIGDFDTLEVEDNIEIFLVKGEKCGIEIEADDNLHDIISISLNGGLLKLSTLREVSSSKKFTIRITYDSKLKQLTAKHDAIVNALAELDLTDITFNSLDYSKLFLNARVKNFTLKQDDKSKVELNLKSENAVIELSKNAHLKALVYALSLKCDLYQKSDAELEGDVMEAKLRLDNNTDFIGKKMITKNMDLITELNANCKINVNTNLSISASGDSEIQIFGQQKIDLKKFNDNARLIKKPTK
jgi:Putative auto-transporter adhesin, head GIN domain